MANQYIDLITYGTGAHTTTKVDFPLVGLDATTIPKSIVVIRQAVANASTNLTIYAPFDLEIIGVRAIKVTTSADAADVVNVYNGTDSITGDLGLNVAAGAVVNATTLDSAGVGTALRQFARGEAITIDPTSSTNCDCVVFIECVTQ